MSERQDSSPHCAMITRKTNLAARPPARAVKPFVDCFPGFDTGHRDASLTRLVFVLRRRSALGHSLGFQSLRVLWYLASYGTAELRCAAKQSKMQGKFHRVSTQVS